MTKHRLTFDIIERVAWSAVGAYVVAVLALPGGMWQTSNWKMAAGTAVFSLVKGLAASRLTGDPGTAATLPASITATGQVVGEVAGTVISETGEVVGEVVGTVTGAIDLDHTEEEHTP